MINYACLIYATAPFLKSQDLRKGFRIIKKNKKLDYVLSISKFKSAYYRSLKINGNKIKPIFKKYVFSRSQIIKDFYFDNAQFTIGKSESWLKKKHAYISNTSYVYIPSYRSQDIDTIEDWKNSEILFQLLKKKKKEIMSKILITYLSSDIENKFKDKELIYLGPINKKILTSIYNNPKITYAFNKKKKRKK